MSEHIPKELRYTDSHEWIRVEDRMATIGITDYAQRQLGDLTFIELPEEGDTVAAGDEIAVVESVKAASDVYAPLGGKVSEINPRVVEEPSVVNEDPFGEGWFFKIEMEHPEEADDLLDPDAYEDLVPEEDEA